MNRKTFSLLVCLCFGILNVAFGQNDVSAAYIAAIFVIFAMPDA